MFRVRRSFYMILMIGSPLTVNAAELHAPFVPVRATGMGGAFTAISNDTSAIWTNPAGISRIRKARSRKAPRSVTLPNIIMGANLDSRKFYKEYKNFSLNADSTANKIAEIVEKGSFSDKPLWTRIALNPIGYFSAGKEKPMAVGLFTNNTIKMNVESSSPETARVSIISDTGANLAFGFTNRTNRFNLGVHIRPTYRYAYDDKIPLSSLIDKKEIQALVKSDSNNGTGYGVDIGGMWTLADFWYPTFAFAVKDLPLGCKKNYLNPYDETRNTVCGTVYSGTVNNSEALSTIDPTDIRLGLSITPRLSRDMGLRFAIDGHHIHVKSGENNYGLPGVETLKQVHAGVELFFGSPLEVNPTSFRMGFSQGFITFGASIRTKFFALEFASYGRDISSTVTPQEDRRYLTSLSFDL